MTPRAAVALTCIAAITAGCQEPFGTDRHDLVGDRIVAVHVERQTLTDHTVLHPRATLSFDGHLWSDETAQFAWFVIDASDNPIEDALNIGTTEYLNAAPEIHLNPYETGVRLVVVVTFPSGSVREATLDVPSASEYRDDSHYDLAFRRVDHVTVSTVEGSALHHEARLDWTTSAADWIEPGDFVRWSTGGLDNDQRTRWMATGGEGQFFELDSAQTDWVAGKLVLDEDDIEDRAVSPSGWTTFAALVLDDLGSNQVLFADLSVGEPGPGIWHHGLFLAADVPVDATSVVGTLVADDAAPWGLALTDIVQWGLLVDREDPFGTRSLSCDGPTNGPLRLDWMAQGLCARPDLVGHRVLVGTR